MDRRAAARHGGKLGLGLLGALALSGCGGTTGFGPPGESVGTTLGNLVAFNKLKVAALSKPKPEEEQIECPPIEVLDGTASARTYASADQSNGNVKYQFSMGETVRECSRAGDQLVLKVGVEGRALIGPVGAPGSFTAPVRIAVRNDNDRKVVISKFYSVPVTIQPGDSQTDFSVVSDPIDVPFTKAHADDDYTILVGFDAQGHPAAQAGPRKGHRKPGRETPVDAPATNG